MDDHILEGDEAYAESFKPASGKVLDHRTFRKPIRSIGLRSAVILPYETSVAEAIGAMRTAKVGSALVTDPHGMLAGIFTERDVLNKLALGEIDARTTKLGAVMHVHPDALTPDDPIGYALRIMSHGGFRHVPLVDHDGRPVGVVSVRDIVDHIADLFPDEILTLPHHPKANIAKSPEGG